MNPQKSKYELYVASKNEAVLFFSGSSEEDMQRGCIGHLRCDFGHKGKEFYHTWFDHMAELKTPEFKEDLQLFIDGLRKQGLLSNLDTMAKWCYDHTDARLDDQYRKDSYGFKAETETYSYYIRCFPQQGDYNAYIYCYEKEPLQMAMNESGQSVNHDMSQRM